MSFIEYNEIPFYRAKFVCLPRSEFVGTNYNTLNTREWLGVACLPHGGISARFNDLRMKREFFVKLLLPLLAKRRGYDQDNPTPVLSPALGENQSGFDGLTQTNLIREQDALRQRRLQCK